MDDDLTTIIAAGILFIMICVFCVWGEQTFVDNVPTNAYVEGKKVYHGPSCGIVVSSSGSTTTIQINSGFLYMFPQKYYTSRNITIEAIKHEVNE